jgi:hypothetical protein
MWHTYFVSCVGFALAADRFTMVSPYGLATVVLQAFAC